MEEKSLISRLIEKFTSVCHNKTAAIKKSIVALTLATGIVLSMGACSLDNLGNTPGGIIGGITNPGSDIGQDGERHSKMFLEATSWQNDFSNYYSNPITFLETQGYDLELIKNGTTPCETTSYIMQEESNSLYLYSRIQSSDGSYATYYLLKYKLTDLEKSDYIYLNDSNFKQAIHLNSELDKIKQPEVVNTISVTKKLEDSILNYSGTKNFDNYLDLIENGNNTFRYRLPYSLDIDDCRLTILYRTSSELTSKNNTLSLITVQLNQNVTKDPYSACYLSSYNGIYDGEATTLCTWPENEEVTTHLLENGCWWKNYIGKRDYNSEFTK